MLHFLLCPCLKWLLDEEVLADCIFKEPYNLFTISVLDMTGIMNACLKVGLQKGWTAEPQTSTLLFDQRDQT